jgi:hypothetical protein
MHAELLSDLVAERHHDLAALTARPVPSAGTGRRTPHMPLPRFRVSWTRTTLSAVTNRGPGRSWVIVISATVPAGLAGEGPRSPQYR